MSTAFWQHTHLKFGSLDFQESRGLKKKPKVNLSTAFWRHTHLNFGSLDFKESRGLEKKPKVNLSTPKSDNILSQNQNLEKQKLKTRENI